MLLACIDTQSVALHAARYDEKLRQSLPLQFAQPFTVARAMKPAHTLAAVAKTAQKKPTGQKETSKPYWMTRDGGGNEGE